MRKKSKIPAFIPNQPGTGFGGFDQGKRSEVEKQKNFENQRKLALRKK